MKRIILASKSPRRKELLEITGFKFEIISKETDETMDLSKNLEDEIKRVALEKANAIKDDNSEAIIIGADTIVVLDNEILLKPNTIDNAINMLSKLNGKKHKVLTGVAITYKDKVINWCEEATVCFLPLTKQEIIDYANTKEPLDKAGAYGIQGKGSLLIDYIQGDYYSIMGLPISKVNKVLKDLI